MGITANLDIGAVEPERIVRFAGESFEGAELDVLLVSCTKLRALEARDRIEQQRQVPIVTSNHAALEKVLELLGDRRALQLPWCGHRRRRSRPPGS